VTLTRRAARSVAGLAMPATIIHGDFHAENVAIVDGRPVIFDWSDGAIGDPLMDLVTWFDRIDDADLRERTWSAITEAWSALLDSSRHGGRTWPTA
jgi:aminoglycoside phosphotransferase (APT) family kinase protein